MERELTATALQPEITARFASLIERGRWLTPTS